MSLYYFLLHYWLHFGGSEFFVRALSVLFAIASVPAIYLLGRRLFDSRVGLMAAALLAVNAYHVQYSQDARSYSLMVLLCLLSSLYFLKSLNEPSRRNRFAYVLSSALAVYAQFFSGLLVIAQWISLKMLDRRQVSRQARNDWRWIALLVLPIVAFVVTTGAGPLRWVQRPGFEGSLDICAASLGKPEPAVAARMRGGVPGSLASCLANPPSAVRTLGSLALPLSFVLAAIPAPTYFRAVVGQAALCSAIFYFLLARTFVACGLRN